MKVFGIAIVRNEVDIVRISVRHNLALGLDRVLVIDNGSTDGTTEELERLATDARIRWTRNESPFYQEEIMTALAREAWSLGADWIVPFDADEFWHVPGSTLPAVLESTGASVLIAPVVNYIQRREQTDTSPDGLMYMNRRVESPIGTVRTCPRLVDSHAIGYVEVLYPPKVITRTSAEMKLGRGRHSVADVPGETLRTEAVRCLHAPIRSPAVLKEKATKGSRIVEAGFTGDESWHLRRWRRIEAEGLLDEEWKANSYRGNFIDVYGIERPVVFDPTLVDLVRPWLESSRDT